MHIIGRIYNTKLKERMIGIKTFHRIQYFYFQNSQLNQFKRYLYPGVYIELEYDEEKTFIRKGIAAYFVHFIHQIYRFHLKHKLQYYDRTELNSSLSSFLNNLGNIMFLDLEMTMPPYTFHGKGFQTEIIQAGFLLINGSGEEICRYNQYILPIDPANVSRRTYDFLKITPQEFSSQAVDYLDFYEELSGILMNYQPSIVIFGKNDRLILNDSFRLHQVDPLSHRIRYVNLSKLIQNYYHLKNEPGLF
nr:hypothetical protein [Anaeroplasmataceae bacterium]